MKSFSERNPVIIGLIGVTGVLVIALGALNYQKLPFFSQGNDYSAYFADAGGLFTGGGVEVSGYPAGKVSSIELDGNRVLIRFWLDKNIYVGDRSEARIRAKSLLGTKVLEVLPRGEEPLVGTIPIDRTTSPYQLPDALGDLATHRPTVAVARHPGADLFRYSGRAEERGAGSGAVRANTQ